MNLSAQERRNRPMTSSLVQVLKLLASLKLTIVCLACAMVLVFVGTLDQVQVGVYEAQLRYFKSFFLYFSLPGSQLKIPWFPGGYTLGGVLLVNLIAAHLSRFRLSWKKVGILILHSGLILLLVGQLFTSVFEEESQIQLDQGQTKNYSESPYLDELAIKNSAGANDDEIISVPASKLAKGASISLPSEGLILQVNDFYENAALIGPKQLPSENYPHLRVGPMAVAVAIPKNFSSKVRLVDAAAHENREALIFMNHPLRYAGLTFYQAGFGNNDHTTILQIMKNPSWLVPYISCGMMAMGLVIQFGMHLISFVRRRVVA